MAISVSAWVWEHSKSRHAAKLVLLYIAWAMREKGDGPFPGWAWPSNAEIAEKTGLSARSVQVAMTEAVKLGELDVRYNAGPKGCNLYRIIARTPAESAPPEDSAPPQDLHHPPAESAPGTGREPEEKTSPTERSTTANTGDGFLFGANGNGTAPKPKRGRGRPAGQKATDPVFAEWYAVYPVHKSFADAEQAWAKVMRQGVDPRVLIAAAKRYRDDEQVLRGYGKYPATWLNKKCWLDEDMPPPQPPPPKQTAAKKTNYSDEEYNGGW